jgi:transmembrane sensor
MAMTQIRLEDFPELPMGSDQDMSQYVPTDAQIGEATLWLAKLRESGAPSSRAFERWMAKHPAHAFAYAEAEALFAFSAVPAKGAARHYYRHGQPVRRRRWGVAMGALAASLVALLAAPRLEALQFLGADAVASPGQVKAVQLKDGSHITLNTRSAVDVDVASDHRGATLRGGEAYFEIAKDPAHPFTVTAGQTRIQVLGTKFNVRIDGDQVIVGVTEGRVRVARSSGNGAPVFLTPGQEAIVETSGIQTQDMDDFVALAWRRHELVTRRTPLRVIVQELNRYRPSGIYIMNNALGESRFSGVFRTDNPDDAIRTLERTLKFRSYTLPTGQTFIY